jgi:16S rRNA (guanine966-N2)-methyltransferase
MHAKWLAPGGWMSVETERGEAIDPRGLVIEATRDVGRAALTLFRLS